MDALINKIKEKLNIETVPSLTERIRKYLGISGDINNPITRIYYPDKSENGSGDNITLSTNEPTGEKDDPIVLEPISKPDTDDPVVPEPISEPDTDDPIIPESDTDSIFYIDSDKILYFESEGKYETFKETVTEKNQEFWKFIDDVEDKLYNNENRDSILPVLKMMRKMLEHIENKFDKIFIDFCSDNFHNKLADNIRDEIVKKHIKKITLGLVRLLNCKSKKSRAVQSIIKSVNEFSAGLFVRTFVPNIGICYDDVIDYYEYKGQKNIIESIESPFYYIVFEGENGKELSKIEGICF